MPPHLTMHTLMDLYKTLFTFSKLSPEYLQKISCKTVEPFLRYKSFVHGDLVFSSILYTSYANSPRV